MDDNLRYSRVLEHSPRTRKLNHNYSIKYILITGVTEKGAKIVWEIATILSLPFGNLLTELDPLGHTCPQGIRLEKRELKMKEEFQNKLHCCNLVIPQLGIICRKFTELGHQGQRIMMLIM